MKCECALNPCITSLPQSLQPFSTCRPILDKHDRVFAVLGGHPRDPAWSEINGEMQDILEQGRAAYSASAKQTSHQRGDFTAVTVGISYGGGQRYVSNLAHKPPSNQAVLDAMLQQKAVRRLANFGNSVMRLFAPRMHAHYSATLDALCARDKDLRPNFPSNAFSCATFNMGPSTITLPHTDHLNLPNGWCSITAVGDYNPKQGGHLVLWDLRMVVEFPPGSTILIPSAILQHSNTAIQEGERRYSFTQFSAGGLFRWVECGFQSLAVSGITPKELNKRGPSRWEQGLAMLSTWAEICQPV
ncbi:hypothetical protein FKP32DRAFT_1568891 [Trametes sanguinea]|nr:hypothetical protein FKP32DRAFT_1568891 [Trametes sanguinea]